MKKILGLLCFILLHIPSAVADEMNDNDTLVTFRHPCPAQDIQQSTTANYGFLLRLMSYFLSFDIGDALESEDE